MQILCIQYKVNIYIDMQSLVHEQKRSACIQRTISDPAIYYWQKGESNMTDRIVRLVERVRNARHPICTKKFEIAADFLLEPPQQFQIF